MINYNDNSYKTAISRKKPSIPARYVANILRSQIQFKSILDFGCGKGADVVYFNNCGLEAFGYDRYFNPVFPSKKFDLVTCTYVLNVIPSDFLRSLALEAAICLIKTSGYILISIRPPQTIKTKPCWTKYNDGYITSRKTFQGLISTDNLIKLIVSCNLNIINTKFDSKSNMILCRKI